MVYQKNEVADTPCQATSKCFVGSLVTVVLLATAIALAAVALAVAIATAATARTLQILRSHVANRHNLNVEVQGLTGHRVVEVHLNGLLGDLLENQSFGSDLEVALLGDDIGDALCTGL